MSGIVSGIVSGLTSIAPAFVPRKMGRSVFRPAARLYVLMRGLREGTPAGNFTGYLFPRHAWTWLLLCRLSSAKPPNTPDSEFLVITDRWEGDGSPHFRPIAPPTDGDAVLAERNRDQTLRKFVSEQGTNSSPRGPVHTKY